MSKNKEGKRVKNMDALHLVMANIFPNRCDNEVYIQKKFDVTEIMNYVRTYNSSEDAEFKMTPFHFFVHAAGKLVYHKPLLNRYIQGRRFYDRNEIKLSFIVRRDFQEISKEILMILPMKADMTIMDTCKEIIGDTTRLREDQSGAVDSTMEFYRKLPRFAQMLMAKVFRWMDFYNIVPESVRKGDTNYSSVLLSNLGSVKCDAPYHHLYNYGSLSIVMTIGEIHKEPVFKEDGSVEFREMVEFGITLDERIADGFYFARCAEVLKAYIENPKLLLAPIKDKTGYEDLLQG